MKPLLPCPVCRTPTRHEFKLEKPTTVLNSFNEKAAAYAQMYGCSDCGHLRRWGVHQYATRFAVAS